MIEDSTKRTKFSIKGVFAQPLSGRRGRVPARAAGFRAEPAAGRPPIEVWTNSVLAGLSGVF